MSKDQVRVTIRFDRSIYEKLLKLKIGRGDKGSFNRWINKEMGRVVNENEILIKGYEVDYSDFE